MLRRLALLVALALLAGCSGRPTTGKATATQHWCDQPWLEAIDALQAGLTVEQFAERLGYPVSKPGDNWRMDRDQLKSRLVNESSARGANKPTVKTSLELWTGDGKTSEEMHLAQQISDRIAAALHKAYGKPDQTGRATGINVGHFGTRDMEFWYRGAWTVTFDPAAYRAICVLSLTFNPNWKPPTSGGNGGVVDNTPGGGTNPGGNNPSGSGGTSTGGTNPGSNTGTNPVGTNPDGTGSSSSHLIGVPGNAEQDEEFAVAIHNRFVNAASRTGGDTLRTRRYRQDADREWLIAGATVDGVQVVGGGGAKATWRFDKIQPDTRIDLYMLLEGKTVPDYLGAAIHCYRLDLQDRGDDLTRRVLQGNPALKPLIDEFVARQRGMATPEGGFTLYHGRTWRFLSPAEVDEMKEATEIEQMCDELAGALKKLDDPAQQYLAKSLVERLSRKGPDAQARGIELVVAARDKQLESIGRTQVTASMVKALKRQLDDARTAAMKAIFDEQAYPYPNPDLKGQAEVDELVDVVRTLWTNPGQSVLDNNPSLGDDLRSLAQLQAYLRTLDPGRLDAAMDSAADFRAAVAKMINLQEYGNATETRRYQEFAEVERDNNEGRSVATAAEREFVSILNAYRKMMGVGPLRINDHLTTAARGHSDYMGESNTFAHEIPAHPDGATPRLRASKAGYGGSVGENIFKGSSAAKSAFDGWAHSSGHHRNMLNPNWTVIGAGNGGIYWTTVFGAAADGSEPSARR